MGDRIEIEEWVDEVAVRNANAAEGHADLQGAESKGGFLQLLDESREGGTTGTGEETEGDRYVGDF